MNIYRVTRNDHWTRGTKNALVEHPDRSPGYYHYAESEDAARRQMEKLFPGETFTVTLDKSDVTMPFKSGKETATADSV